MTRRSFVHLRRPLLAVALIAGSAVLPGAAPNAPRPQPFAQAELFVELNHTDSDLGLHAAIDGGAWTGLVVEGPRERGLLQILSAGRLGNQGLTQVAFESAEPTFDELDPVDFFRRFPEGVYEIEARSASGGYASRVRLSHVLAAPVVATVSGQPAAENCDAPALPIVGDPVRIEWDPVTTSHPEVGRPGPVTISRYQFFVEQGPVKLSVDLPPTATAFEVPASITAARGPFKFEIIARTSTGNNTAIESCFVVP